jgi:hypothetical protein
MISNKKQSADLQKELEAQLANRSNPPDPQVGVTKSSSRKNKTNNKDCCRYGYQSTREKQDKRPVREECRHQ